MIQWDIITHDNLAKNEKNYFATISDFIQDIRYVNQIRIKKNTHVYEHNITINLQISQSDSKMYKQTC